MMDVLKLAKFYGSRHLWETAGDDTQYIITMINECAYVYFKQSDSNTDWKNNFAFFAKPYKQMKTRFYVHGGFLKCWKLIEDRIIAELKDLKPKSICISGWSYGGAIALICKEAVWYHFPELRDVTECITFGAPRVLWFYNYDKVKERWKGTRQFTNGSDIVTCVPPLVFGFRHPTTQIHIGNIRKLVDFSQTDYHHIKEYIETLEKCR